MTYRQIIKGVVVAVFYFFSVSSSYAWNELGHRLIAQIAFDNLSKHTQEKCLRYNGYFDEADKAQSWQLAASWLDWILYTRLKDKPSDRWKQYALPSFSRFVEPIREDDVKWVRYVHYIDQPYATEQVMSPGLNPINAVWAIKRAKEILNNVNSFPMDKSLSLRVILHVVGDIHQPLHAITHVSKEYPDGDKGGNGIKIYDNGIAKNLHAYWDRGAGFLLSNHRLNDKEVAHFASLILEKHPCNPNAMDLHPKTWAKESYDIAVNAAYKPLEEYKNPDKAYRLNVQQIVEERIALAGCRLAAVLEHIA